MSDNKKYYYMRLKENFFDTPEMKILESQPDGYRYSNILLKLYLLSLRNEGKLMVNDRIPYNSSMIATITGHTVGTVEKAMQFFKDLGLIDVIDTGAIYMLDIQNFIGQGSSDGDRKKLARSQSGQMSGQMSDKRPPEIEIELKDRDRDKAIVKDIAKTTISSEKEIGKEKKSMKNKIFKPPTVEEVIEYANSIGHGEFDAERFVDHYETNGWMVGRTKMKDWKAAVRNWLRNNQNNSVLLGAQSNGAGSYNSRNSAGGYRNGVGGGDRFGKGINGMNNDDWKPF